MEEFKGFGAGSYAVPVAGDFDNDGVPELLVARTLEEEPWWFRRSGFL